MGKFHGAAKLWAERWALDYSRKPLLTVIVFHSRDVLMLVRARIISTVGSLFEAILRALCSVFLFWSSVGRQSYIVAVKLGLG